MYEMHSRHRVTAKICMKSELKTVICAGGMEKQFTDKQILVSHERLLIDVVSSAGQRGRAPNRDCSQALLNPVMQIESSDSG